MLESGFWSELSSAITAAVIVTGVGMTLLRKWFLDRTTYFTNRDLDRQYVIESEERLITKFENIIIEIQKQKADAEDLRQAERKIERLDMQLSNLTATLEKQCYRMDLLMDNLPQQIKDFRADVTDQLKEIREDVKSVKEANVKLQLKIQSIESRFGN